VRFFRLLPVLLLAVIISVKRPICHARSSSSSSSSHWWMIHGPIQHLRSRCHRLLNPSSHSSPSSSSSLVSQPSFCRYNIRGGETTISDVPTTMSSTFNNGSGSPNPHEQQQSLSSVKTSRGTMTDDRLQRGGKPKHSPVVYQYFGSTRKSRGGNHQSSSSTSSTLSSTNTGDSIHFIMLGRRLDRFRNVGKILASRGFDTMVCERVQQRQQQQQNRLQQSQAQTQQYRGVWGTSTKNPHDAPDLVLEILDALKWDKVVLVGCDEESVLAMETAMMLAPDQVVGLILCGDLTEANRLAIESGGIEIDSFLHRVLDCPFAIVWDGRRSSFESGIDDVSVDTTSSSSTTSQDNIDHSSRCLILGGGDAPYQSKPEQFAWVLTRFVEEKLEFVPFRPTVIGGGGTSGEGDATIDDPSHPPGTTSSANNNLNNGGRGGGFLQSLNLPFGINSLVSPEGRLLLGRAVAAALFYTSIMKVFLVQYGVLRSGVISIKNSVDSVDALRRKVFQAVGLFVVNFGYIPDCSV
jgi:hypothetical protein